MKSLVRDYLHSLSRLRFTDAFSYDPHLDIFSNSHFNILASNSEIYVEDIQQNRKTFFNGNHAFPVFARFLTQKISPSKDGILLKPIHQSGEFLCFVDSRKKRYLVSHDEINATLDFYYQLLDVAGEQGVLSLPSLYPEGAVAVSKPLNSQSLRVKDFMVAPRYYSSSVDLSTDHWKVPARSASKLLSFFQIPHQKIEFLDSRFSPQAHFTLGEDKIGILQMGKRVDSSLVFKLNPNLKPSKLYSFFAGLGINITSRGTGTFGKEDFQKVSDFLRANSTPEFVSGDAPVFRRKFTPLQSLKSPLLPLSLNQDVEKITVYDKEATPFFQISSLIEEYGLSYDTEKVDQGDLFIIKYPDLAGPIFDTFIQNVKELNFPLLEEKDSGAAYTFIIEG